MRRGSLVELINLNAYWLGLAFLWNSMHVILLPALLLEYVSDERKNTALGMLTFSGLIIAMLIQPLAGAISDRWSSRFGRRRPAIALGTLADLIFLGLMAAAGGIPLLAIGYIGLQFTSNIAHGPAQGLMHDKIPKERMGIASGIKNLFDMGGLVLSSLIMGRIFLPASPEIALGVVAVVLVGSAAFTLFGVRERSTVSEREKTPIQEWLRSTLSIDFHRHSPYWRLILARLFFLWGVYGIQVFAQYYIRDTLQSENPIKLTGDLLAVIVLSLIAFSIIAGYLCDRLGRKPMHYLAAVLVSIGSILMAFADRATLVLIFGSIVGAGVGVFISANWALANDLAPSGEAGKFLGLTNLATAGAGALSRLSGPVIDVVNNAQPGQYLGYNVLFAGATVMAFVSMLILSSVPEVVMTRRSRSTS
ncbi:MAG: MFS transporter [Anaerolineales bacterium]|nr:MFS transporter [Anaerolineales bacterium]